MTESKWLKFDMHDPKPGCKTLLCIVRTKDDHTLGLIKWHSPWRQYVFYPVADTLYAASCLEDIKQVINIMKERT